MIGAVKTLILTLALLGAADQQPTPPPPAPPPGSAATYRSGDELLAALQKAADRGGMSSGAIGNTDQYRINLIRRVKPGSALAHAGNTELHYITEGAGTIVTGGTLVRPAGGGGATIQNGETRRVVRGDVILVPADTPHWYKDVEGSITYLEVRFVAPVQKP
jgi:mannose-6-phosphate isomerase-like protein (cupin superfamily)